MCGIYLERFYHEDERRNEQMEAVFFFLASLKIWTESIQYVVLYFILFSIRCNMQQQCDGFVVAIVQVKYLGTKAKEIFTQQQH